MKPLSEAIYSFAIKLLNQGLRSTFELTLSKEAYLRLAFEARERFIHFTTRPHRFVVVGVDGPEEMVLHREQLTEGMQMYVNGGYVLIKMQPQDLEKLLKELNNG